MPEFLSDKDVDQLNPERSLADFLGLLSLLCGEDVTLPPEDKDNAESAQESARVSVLKGVFDLGRNGFPPLTLEQLNEILLLVGQGRVSEWFFRFFFLNRDLQGLERSAGEEPRLGRPARLGPQDAVEIPAGLKHGVKKFRGFALLCFGNFRFAYKRFNRAATEEEFTRLLRPWDTSVPNLQTGYESRPGPVVTISPEGSQVPREKTWQLGYLSRGRFFKDAAKVHRVDAHIKGQSLEQRLALEQTTEIRQHLRDYWGTLPAEFIEKWSPLLPDLQARLQTLSNSFEEARVKGIENTVKYLTWDLLDIYVATSMREVWHFTEVFDAVQDTNADAKAALSGLKLRWFDPTQSYEDSIIDKGLVEGLMLKRASATIYMVQDGETLGKDSELAATLAQGKPVIAFVPEHNMDADLLRLAKSLAERPVEYFRKRLRQLVAAEFFERLDNVKNTIKRLALIEDATATVDEFHSRIEAAQNLVDGFHPDFELVSSEEMDFRHAHSDEFVALGRLMASIESVEADNRAATLRSKHPLAFQVNLGTGVANGLLVARSAEKVASLIRLLLLNQVEFDIEPLCEPGESGRRLGTVLVESTTRSRFRVVTANPTLTNSFWSFYGAIGP